MEHGGAGGWAARAQKTKQVRAVLLCNTEQQRRWLGDGMGGSRRLLGIAGCRAQQAGAGGNRLGGSGRLLEIAGCRAQWAGAGGNGLGGSGRLLGVAGRRAQWAGAARRKPGAVGRHSWAAVVCWVWHGGGWWVGAHAVARRRSALCAGRVGGGAARAQRGAATRTGVWVLWGETGADNECKCGCGAKLKLSAPRQHCRVECCRADERTWQLLLL